MKTMQNLFDQMGPRDDDQAAAVAEHWMEMIVDDSFNGEDNDVRSLDIAEYALALGHLKELVVVHIDAALADMSGRPETGKAIINVSYNPAHCYPRPMGSGAWS